MKKFLIIFILNFLFLNKSYGLIEVDITRGNLDPLPIAISPLHVDIKSENYDGIKIKDGVYYYIIVLDGETSFSGPLTIIR